MAECFWCSILHGQPEMESTPEPENLELEMGDDDDDLSRVGGD